MKALILAAGRGKRMGKYTEKLPKGMLMFNGKTLIEWQIEKLRSVGLDEIVIITGYKGEAINYPGICYHHNPDYAQTNMIETLMCAQNVLDTDILLSYSDIIYRRTLVKMAIEHPADIAVAVDANWRDYWKLRFGTTEADLETLSISKEGLITELGRPVSSSKGIGYRYIGLIKFSQKGMAKAIELYDNKKSKNESWKQSGKPFRKGYMTDLLDELIQEGLEVRPVITRGGWLEFDTADDYVIACRLHEAGKTAGLFEHDTLA